MSRSQANFLNTFILAFLVILLAISPVDVVSVPRICGRVEIGHQHERPKLFQIAEVKHAKYNLTHTLLTESFSRRPQHTQFYQHAKKQSKRIWRGSRLNKKHREIINILWTRSNPLYEEKAEKFPQNPTKYTKPYALYVSSPFTRTFRTGKKIKRQDVTTANSFRAFDYFGGIAELSQNIKPKEKLTTIEKDDRRKVPFVQYVKKKINLPRLAPFTSKPFRTPPPFTGLRESYLSLKPIGDAAYTPYKNIYRTAVKSLHNKLSDSKEKITTKKNRHRKISFLWVSENITEPTTVKDKVKFFERYDQFTAVGKRRRAELENLNTLQMDTKLQDVKVFLDDVNQDIPHMDDNYLYSKRAVKRDSGNLNEKVNNNLVINKLNEEPVCGKRNSLNSINDIPTLNSDLKYKSTQVEAASWEEYPFVAVYIYEPSQVHCDAAALSPHWLVTAGACLYRHQRDISLGDRSAFVTYCGADWRSPERIAYVKESLVHPEYHPRDRARRHQFNIGLVRVVNSMQSSCAGWSPVTLMAKQFVADPLGSPATAVGWGLDRYAGLDSTTDLAKLMQYKGKIFSEVCPGNPEYSKLVQVKTKLNPDPDVYCMLLPPRKPNEEDVAHGNLLLSEGKLIALYLEEEQRPWAEASAQYTSVWRLAPWVRETAKEHKGTDNITFVDI